MWVETAVDLKKVAPAERARMLSLFGNATKDLVDTAAALRPDLRPDLEALMEQLKSLDRNALILLEAGTADPRQLGVHVGAIPKEAVQGLAKAQLQERATEEQRGHELRVAGINRRATIIAALIALAAGIGGALIGASLS